MPDLPLDIHFQILGHLVLDAPRPIEGSESQEQVTNRATLWAYAKVSSSFRDRAYSLLFSTVVLEAWLGGSVKPADQLSQLQQMADMLSNNAPSGNVVRHIKTFCLFVVTPASRFHHFIQKGRLTQILDALYGPCHGVESLSFIVACNGLRPWEYSASDREFQRAIQDLIRSPRLKHVQLCGIEKVPGNIFHEKEIQRVELYGVGFDVAIVDMLFPSSTESIGMDESVAIASTVFQIIAKGLNLKQIYCQVKSELSMARMIEIATLICADTLRAFHVQISGIDFSRALPDIGSPPPGKIYHFCYLKRLTSLRISEVIGTGVIHVLRHFLELCSFSSELGELILDTLIHLDHDNGTESLPHPERWCLLDRLLTQPTSMLNAIPKIVIIVQFNVSVNPPSDRAAYDAEMLERLHERLPEFIAARTAARIREVKVNTVFQEVGPLARGSKHSVFARCGGKGVLRIPSYPNTW